MNESDYFPTAISKLRELLLALPQARNVDSLLQMMIQKYAEDPSLALCRIWLIRPGDQCETCRLRKECLDQTQCLHLVAQSYGVGADPKKVDTEDDYTRIPLGVGKVGRSAVTAEVEDALSQKEDLEYMVSRHWAQRVNVLGLAVIPVVFRGKVLGVNSFVPFKDADMKGEGLFWGRLVADHLAVSITNAEAFEKIEVLNKQLAEENEYLNQELEETAAFGEILGQSPPMKSLVQQIEMVAGTDANVLITGESGTGKELVAREIHQRSQRSNRPLIKVNCASIPRDLYESEFFGHVKGSFTGAIQDRRGRFELANGGTLFLDEVGEIPLEMQSKLLRVIQEGEFERIGDERTQKTEVRILAATNRNLKKEVQAGAFRGDLFYRLNVFPVELPPLKERKGDIPLLANHFVSLASRKFNKPVKPLSANLMSQLQKYDWPGNIRELQYLIERAVIISQGGRIKLELPDVKTEQTVKEKTTSQVDVTEVIPEKEMKRREKENIIHALNQCAGKIYGEDGAAKLLGIKPTTLTTRIKAMGIKKTFLVK
ncbi:MAG: AAA domain-containing protein [Candidatus Nitronauta litoralis]|uniref:AAA domain-containing protein n=1 Tax=Candidatus Nitronauta litoralis TaxID=2705533 RepID=A0A7T0BWH5_9BACT|nr:MAG: AAA domain-containing protein [Candidatus Nitronauta litoralis]